MEADGWANTLTASTEAEHSDVHPMRTMSKTRKTKITDNYIREVNVNYRTTGEERFKVTNATHVAKFVRSILTDNSREHSIALFLDGSSQIASYSIISIGGANSAPFAPRELFQRAVLVGAISIVLVHNHPSGSLAASEADRAVTMRLKEAGDLMGIAILDHVIVTDQDAVSLRELSTIW